MSRLREGYAVLLGGCLLVAALFLPGVKEAIFPDKVLSVWVIVAMSAAAVFDIGQDALTNILAFIFIGNLLFVGCTVFYPLLKGGPLSVASWLFMFFTAAAIAMTLFFLPSTHFAVGHYLWLTGMCLVAWGFYRKAKR